MKSLMKSLMLLLFVAICTFSIVAQEKLNPLDKTSEVFSDKNIEAEIKILKQMKIKDKIKVRRAIEDLEAASLKASASNDSDEISYFALAAENSVEAAVPVLPDGSVKGSIIACNKALGHSFFLRLVSSGKENPNNADVAKLLEDIVVRYKLAKIPKYERAAKVLDFADFFVKTARLIASEADIVEKDSDNN